MKKEYVGGKTNKDKCIKTDWKKSIPQVLVQEYQCQPANYQYR